MAVDPRGDHRHPLQAGMGAGRRRHLPGARHRDRGDPASVAFVIGLRHGAGADPDGRGARLEDQVLGETGASHRRRRATTASCGTCSTAWRSRPGSRRPRFAVIDDAGAELVRGRHPAPSTTIVGVTTGLSRPADARRARSGARLRGEPDPELGRRARRAGRSRSPVARSPRWRTTTAARAPQGVVGWVPRTDRRMAAGVGVTRPGHASATVPRCASPAIRRRCIRALEKLDADSSEITCVSRATAPLWIEFPATRSAGAVREW